MSSTAVPVKAKSTLRFAAGVLLLTALHIAALGVMFWSEDDVLAKVVFLLAWSLLNFFWMVLLRSATAAGALSLMMIIVLILLSRFKFEALNMTVTFFEVMLIDRETFVFLLGTFPDLYWTISALLVGGFLAAFLLWWIDPFRLRFRTALAGCAVSFAALAGISFARPVDHDELFVNHNYTSMFARSGALAAMDLATGSLLEADATVTDRLTPDMDIACKPSEKPPHIILVLDESGFDATIMPGIKVVPDYKRRFLSFDGNRRNLIVEGSGGPTWFTEYNLLSGLSVRSFGRFAEGVTRIAAGRVERGLPRALTRCGYRTFSIYPVVGEFLGARSYQLTTGIENFFDANDLNTRYREFDSFYYDFAMRSLQWERGRGPLFYLVYTTANHMPWNVRWRLENTPDWRDTGQLLEVDEYLRRQEMSTRDFPNFLRRLKENFPGEQFLVVRFGDHQPTIAKNLINPILSPAEIAEQIRQYDPKYFTTYYSIHGVNFTPVDLSSARETLEAAYLPLVVLEAAGVALDASFVEQKKILERCNGLFYRCNAGAEARRFNQLLINSGMIKGF